MIEIKDLTFGYSQKKILFEKLNLSLEPGHIYGLLGKNGAGKSTLIKNITGLAFPKWGSCKINGRESSQRSPELLENFFLVPEEIYLPSLRVEKFVQGTAGLYPKFDKADFSRYLKEFDIEPTDNISDLSFGQQKKVMIAFALATNTGIVIMDEPTNGLDIPSKVQFRKIVSEALSEQRIIIISTHQVRDLDNLIDTLVIINDRKIILNSGVDAIEEKLVFKTLSSLDGQNVLYHEKSVHGYNVIMRNDSAKSSKVDLEMLFNAMVSDNDQVIDELKQLDYV